ncbi:conserved hypothetical protein [Ricinus communis]|uniref:DNA helicase related protein n=1 Tax=Ricinus communis TaxID=3988 RepID=B9TDS0_RICCO|nr:conserved hypothetical protein [Ricinus communis]
MPMNFGPMNQQGGERRLNVAITRARQELRVFGSFKPEKMDLSRTQALGVRDLKHFLEFAERGARALGEAVAGSIGDFDSPFEKAVCAALAERGWAVHPQVGVSAFRIDLGIVDPDAPGRYLAGVECDGATYHRSATARDRDKLREHVLRGLGWDIVRIWSTDWWIDMPGTLDKVHTQLEALLAEQRAERATGENLAAELAQQVIAATKVDGGTDPTARSEVPVAVSKTDGTSTPAADETSSRTETYARNDFISITEHTPKAEFIEVDLAMTDHVADAEQFFEREYDARLLAMVEHVVRTEGPVRDEVLARRVARAHGWSRTGARILERVVALGKQHFHCEPEDVGLFFWPTGEIADRTVVFRRPALGSTRAVDEIALAELAALAAELQARGYDRETGLNAMAKEVGLLRMRATSRERLERAWLHASH